MKLPNGWKNTSRKTRAKKFGEPPSPGLTFALVIKIQLLWAGTKIFSSVRVY